MTISSYLCQRKKTSSCQPPTTQADGSFVRSAKPEHSKWSSHTEGLCQEPSACGSEEVGKDATKMWGTPSALLINTIAAMVPLLLRAMMIRLRKGSTASGPPGWHHE